MSVVRLAVPFALLMWFLWKARDNRLFILGIPVLMVMGPSVFFDLMRPFWTPGRLENTTHIMIWLVIAWAVILWTGRRDPERPEVGFSARPACFRRRSPSSSSPACLCCTPWASSRSAAT